MKKLLKVFEELIFRLTSSPDAASPGVKLTVEKLLGRMQRDGFSFQDGRFSSDKLSRPTASAPRLIALTDESISEHIEKANAKIELATQPAQSLLPIPSSKASSKRFTRRSQARTFKDSEGDIRTLYAAVAERLNLSPKEQSLETYLKAILQGSVGQIGGLYELANKASDRHARKYNPAPHHAKLAVNVAFTLCEFILSSYHYQQQKQTKKATA